MSGDKPKLGRLPSMGSGSAGAPVADGLQDSIDKVLSGPPRARQDQAPQPAPAAPQGDPPPAPRRPPPAPAGPPPAPAGPPPALTPQVDPPPDDNAADFAGVPRGVFDLGDSDEPPADADDDDLAVPGIDTPLEVSDQPKAKNSWQKLKGENKELKGKVSELERAVQAAKDTKPPEVEQLVEMQRKLAEADDRIGKLDITQSAGFQGKYDAPLEMAERRGLSVLTRAEVPVDDAKALLSQLFNPNTTANELEGLLVDQPMAVQGALYGVASEYSEAYTRREAAIQDWRNEQAALKADESVVKNIALAQDVEVETSAAVDRAAASGNWLYTKVEGNKEWNAAVDERVSAVKGLLRGANRAELANWVAEGLTAQRSRELFLEAVKRYDALKARFESAYSRTPRFGAGAPVSDRPAPSDPDGLRGKTPEEVLSEMFPSR